MAVNPGYSLWRQLDVGLRSLTPGLITVVLALLLAVPIYRPDLLPPPAIFAIGVLEDLASGATLGGSALVLLGAYALVLNQRRLFLGKPFALTWVGFIMVAALAAFVSWATTSLLALKFLRASEPFLRFAATSTMFPLLVWFFIRTHRRVLPALPGVT
ncbi:MAG: rod shape-determining protein MreD [Elsteraceae bacterium]